MYPEAAKVDFDAGMECGQVEAVPCPALEQPFVPILRCDDHIPIRIVKGTERVSSRRPSATRELLWKSYDTHPRAPVVRRREVATVWSLGFLERLFCRYRTRGVEQRKKRCPDFVDEPGISTELYP